jgi:hypothetical protein
MPMLADSFGPFIQSGSLSSDVHRPKSSLYELLDFVADELPRWRDRTERKNLTSESELTAQLCSHLNSVARHSPGWDCLQFRTEVPDEKQRGRKIDMAPSPCGVAVWIEGRRHTDFDTLFPVECKRLPTPLGDNRDEREYVVNRHASTGGIQRFKAGHHGASHDLGAIIGYMQDGTTVAWQGRIAGWIGELVNARQPGWSDRDMLHLLRHAEARGLAVLHSSHTRESGLPDIELRHLWIKMNGSQ